MASDGSRFEKRETRLTDPRLKHRLLQLEIINRPDPRDQLVGKPAGYAVHERSTHRAEVVRHGIPRFNGVGLGELRELLSAACVRGALGGDDEVGGEHAGCDLWVGHGE